MGQVPPPTHPPKKPLAEIATRGNKSALSLEDARFIDFRATIRPDDLYSYLFKSGDSIQRHDDGVSGTHRIKAGGHILEKIDYEEVFNPLATGSQTCTFWKTEDRMIYFFKISGGLGRDDLFGPFLRKKHEFTFSGTP